MLSYLLTTALAATTVAGMGTGLRFRRQNASDADDAKKLIVGGGPTGIVAAADFDGASFDIVANDTTTGTSASWMLFKEPNLLYAVDENSNNTRLFNVCPALSFFSLRSRLANTPIQFDPATNNLKLVQNAAGSSGVVYLEFNQDKTVLVGAAFGQGQVDVWDASAPDGTLKVCFLYLAILFLPWPLRQCLACRGFILIGQQLLKQIPVGGTPGPVKGRQDSPRKPPDPLSPMFSRLKFPVRLLTYRTQTLIRPFLTPVAASSSSTTSAPTLL